MDPRTGAIRALVGGRDFDDSKFDRAVQAVRQPGSTFKPIVYSDAIQNGRPLSYLLDDSPLTVDMGSPEGRVTPIAGEGAHQHDLMLGSEGLGQVPRPNRRPGHPGRQRLRAGDNDTLRGHFAPRGFSEHG